MKVNWVQHKGKCGIYCIRNIVNGKVYIGKSIDIATRIAGHKCDLRKKNIKKENDHLINSWWKYGEENFEYIILELSDKNNPDLESFLRDRELYWIDTYNSTDRSAGYNLRRDSSTKMIVHPETRLKMSKTVKGSKNPNYGRRWTKEMKENMSSLKKEGHRIGLYKGLSSDKAKEISKKQQEMWVEDPSLRSTFCKKVSVGLTKSKIQQVSKDGKTVIKTWRCISDIIDENPSYKKHNIHAVCSGEKPSIYGYKWLKVLNDEL